MLNALLRFASDFEYLRQNGIGTGVAGKILDFGVLMKKEL